MAPKNQEDLPVREDIRPALPIGVGYESADDRLLLAVCLKRACKFGTVVAHDAAPLWIWSKERGIV